MEAPLIELFYWPTPNGWKITLFLEESGLPYQVHPVNIGAGDQFKPEFLAISPNNRMPAIIDRAPADGGPPLSVFESGAILEYLADKTGLFAPKDLRGRTAVREWLYWQVGGVGPMIGQYNHFVHYAAEKIPYAMTRYTQESDRLVGVLERRLKGRDYIVDDYSIADMATFPWVNGYNKRGGDLSAHANVRAWIDRIYARPATKRALAVGKDFPSTLTADAKKTLFGQTAASVAAEADKKR